MRDFLPRSYRFVLVSLGQLLLLATVLAWFFEGKIWSVLAGFLPWFWLVYLSHLLGLLAITRRLKHPVGQLESLLEAFGQSNFQRDHVAQAIPIYNRLGRSLGDLGRQLQLSQQEAAQGQEQMTVLLSYLAVGVLVLDNRFTIQLASQSMRDYLPGQGLEGQPFWQVNRTAELNHLLDRVYTSQTAQSQEVFLYSPSERVVEVSASPVVREGRVSRILLLFYDVTHLRKLEKMRQDFVTNVSHELRTPVTAIKGFAETLLAGAKEDPEALDQFLGIIDKESNRLQAMISDIFYLARLEQGQLEEHHDLVDVGGLAQDLAVSLYQALTSKGLTFQLVNQLTGPVKGDRGRLYQVLNNLLTNAIRYTEPGGQIGLTLTEQADQVLLAVSDTGIGIPDHELERIFERFYRVNKGRSRQTGGSGLGLAIVSQLVETMGGQIEVSSQVGQGTTFTVYLPK